MALQSGKSTRRAKPNYIYSMISITLVLFLIGCLATVLVFSKLLSDSWKESLEVVVILRSDISEPDILRFQKQVEKKPQVLSSRYISKEDAPGELQKDIGGDLSFAGDDFELPPSLELRVNADFVSTENMETLKDELLESEMVTDVDYSEGAVSGLGDIANQVIIIFAVIGGLLFFVSLILINNTIRLSLYSNRFLIKSMQLVGATKWFIIRPMIYRSVGQGLISGLIAVAVISGLLMALELMGQGVAGSAESTSTFAGIILDLSEKGLTLSNNLVIFAGIFLIIVFIGMLMSWLSTFFALSRYLRMKLDDLY